MSMLGSLKDVVVGRAVRLMSDPRLTKVASSPRVVDATSKMLSLGGSVRAELAKTTRLAASVFGIATDQDLATLRSTVRTLEDAISTLEARDASSNPSRGATRQ